MDEGQIRLEERLQSFLKEGGLACRGKAIMLAVSGGLDSMVMLDLFHGLKVSWELQLSVVHVNHHLRGKESDGDEQFVAEAASQFGIPVFPMHVDVESHHAFHRVSKQEAARDLRYRAFEAARLKAGADSVATAHHAGDNAETVLMNALRGAGIRGLSGIPLMRGNGAVIRPLLFATREEISRYAKDRGIRYREDSSNASTAYTRNALRRVVIPELEALMHTDIVESLNRVSAIMRSLQERVASELNSRISSIINQEDEKVTVSLEPFLREPLYLQEEMILEIFRELGIEPSARKVQSCLDLCRRPTGRFLQLASHWRLYRERDAIIFAVPPAGKGFEYTVELGNEYLFPAFRFGSQEIGAIPDRLGASGGVEYVDADKIGARLVLRTWKDGDWFFPLGMESRKKLSDFFTNEKVPLLAKRTTPILESEGSVVWVCGLRLDQRFRITPTTKRVVKLEYSPSNPQ